MAWMICGTVPDASFPLTGGRWRLDGGFLHAEGGGIAPLSVQRGTPALLGTALLTCETLGVEPPTALLAGDTGNGDGSRKLYSRLAASSSLSGVRGITFHYLFPDLDGHNRVLMALEEADPKPVLVADAGFMYVAKMSGYADAYDLFTPDAGELAFLADEKAPHPFYTRGFLLAADEDIPSLVERAYQHGNAARFLLDWAAVIALALCFIVFTLIKGSRFMSFNNMINILRAMSITTVFAIAATVTMAPDGFDMSACTLASCSAYVFVSMYLWYGLPLFACVLITIAVTLIMYQLTMFLILVCKIPDMLATCALQFVHAGLGLAFTGGSAVSAGLSAPKWFGAFHGGDITPIRKGWTNGSMNIGKSPYIIIIMLLCVVP